MHERDVEHTEAPQPVGVTARPAGIVGRFRARLWIAGALLVVTGAVLVPGAARAATGSLTSGDYAGPEGTQHYQLYVPSTYQAETPMPLVVALHGCTQTADQFRRLTRWDALAEAQGFIVLLPQQDAGANTLKCWNFFQDAHMHRSAGDPARIAAVTSLIENTYNVDPHMVYVAGLSAGGGMASVLAATHPDYFAAVGIHSGCEYASTATCAGYKSADPAQAGRQAYKEMGPRAHAMPFIAFQGDADTTVPPANADQLVQQWLLTNDLADDGAANGSVPSAPTNTTPGFAPGGRSYTVRTYADSHKAELAKYWLVRGMKHAWSGGDASQPFSDPSGPDATAAMYAFFLSHPAPYLTRPAPPARQTPAAPAAPGASKTAEPGVPSVSKPKLSHGKIVFTISGAGSVTLRLQRGVRGHLKQGNCVAGKRKRHGCTKHSTTATIVRRAAKARRMAIALPTRVHGRRLPRGRYRVVVTPADLAGRPGKSKTLQLGVR